MTIQLQYMCDNCAEFAYGDLNAPPTGWLVEQSPGPRGRMWHYCPKCIGQRRPPTR